MNLSRQPQQSFTPCTVAPHFLSSLSYPCDCRAGIRHHRRRATNLGEILACFVSSRGSFGLATAMHTRSRTTHTLPKFHPSSLGTSLPPTQRKHTHCAGELNVLILISRTFLQGNLKGYDHTINLVLEGCSERIYSQARGVEQVRGLMQPPGKAPTIRLLGPSGWYLFPVFVSCPRLWLSFGSRAGNPRILRDCPTAVVENLVVTFEICGVPQPLFADCWEPCLLES